MNQDIEKMININEVIETNKMVDEHNLDVRTITLGISLLDCIDSDLKECNKKVFEKIFEIFNIYFELLFK